MTQIGIFLQKKTHIDFIPVSLSSASENCMVDFLKNVSCVNIIIPFIRQNLQGL